MAVVALAIAWAVRLAADRLGPGAPRRRSLGCFAQSRFHLGLDRLRDLLGPDHEDALNPWRGRLSLSRESAPTQEVVQRALPQPLATAYPRRRIPTQTRAERAPALPAEKFHCG